MTTTATPILKKMLLLFLIIAGLYYAKVFLMPLCIGGILAILFLPLCNWLQKKKISKWVAVLCCLLVLLIIILGFVFLIGWQINELTNDVTFIKQKAIETISLVQKYIFNQFGITAARQSQILTAEQPSYSNLMQLMAGSITYIFGNLILILAYVVFLLYYRGHIRNFFIKTTVPIQKMEMNEMLSKAANVSQQYLVGLSKMIFCLWIM